MAANYSFPCAFDELFGFRTLYLTIPLVAIVVGKSVFILFTAYRTNIVKTHTKFLVSSLSATDLILAVSYVCFGDSENLVMTLGISQPNYLESLLLGAWYSSVVLYYAQIAIFALERYIQIAHPFLYINALTTRNACIILLCLWAFGLCYMFIPVLVYTEDHYHESCILFHPPLEYYCIGAFVSLVSAVTVLVSNFKISSLAYRNKTARLARRLPSSGVKCKVTFRDHFLAAARSVKFFSVMFGIYFICTSPSVVCAGVNIFFHVPTFIFMPAIYLIPVDSVLSFIFMFFMNKRFSKAARRALSDVMTCLCKGQLILESCSNVLNRQY